MSISHFGEQKNSQRRRGGNAGGWAVNEILPGGQGVAGGLWYAGDCATGGGGDTLVSAAWCEVDDIAMGGHRSIRYPGRCICLSLRHTDVSFIAIAGRVDFTLFQCTDAAIAILAGIAGGIIAQHFSYATCFLFASSATLLAAFGVFARLNRNSRSL